MRRSRWLAAIAALATVLLPLGLRAEPDAPLIIQARVGQLLNGSQVKIAGEAIASTVVLPAFYERGEYRPAWTDPDNVDALLAAIADSASDADFRAAMEKIATPIQYLDQPEFSKFFALDAKRLADAVRTIGRVEEKK